MISTMEVVGVGDVSVARAAGTDGGPDTPHSNRGVAGALQKPNFALPLRVWVTVDRLRVQFWRAGKLEDANNFIMGGLAGGGRPRSARRRGSDYCRSVGGVMEAAGGEAEGRPYVEVREYVDRAGVRRHASLSWHFEFNPAKLSEVVRGALLRTFVLLGVPASRMNVERVDAAVDYGAPRSQFVLDARRHKLTHHGVGASGAETTACGDSRPNRWQLYDKSLERASAGHDFPANRTRFEFQHRPAGGTLRHDPESVDGASGASVRLDALAEVCPPGLGDIGVRFMPWAPDEIADNESSLLLSLLRCSGIRECLRWGHSRWSRDRLLNWLGCLCPLVEPSPSAACRLHWAASVQRELGWMLEALRPGGGVA